MHVLYIHQHFATNQGFIGTRSYDYARYLVQRGHRVTVLTGRYPGAGLDAHATGRLVSSFDLEGVRIVMIDVPYRNQMGILPRVGSFLAFAAVSSVLATLIRGVDVVYATSTPLTVGLPALAARFLRGRPYAFEVRDIWPETLVSMGVMTNPAAVALATAAELTFYRFSGRVVGISRGIASRLADRGIPASKLEVLYTGVDVAIYEGVPPRHDLLQGLGLAGRVVAVYAGAHSTANHLEYVLDAAEILRDEPGIAFLLVGDGKTRDALISSAHERGLSNVVFLERQPKRDLVGLLKACDLGLMVLKDLPDFTAAMPNKFYDYLAAGLPVAVNFPGELVAHLEDHRCGFHVPGDDPSTLAARVREFAALPPEVRRRMGERARQLVQERFDRRVLVDELERILGAVRS